MERTFCGAKSVQMLEKKKKEKEKYDGCSKVSYPKSVSFFGYILATYGRTLSWNKIVPGRLTRAGRILFN